jgi:hypothetical protein
VRAASIVVALVAGACSTMTPFERAYIANQRLELDPPRFGRIVVASYRGWRDPHWEIVTFFEAGEREVVARRIEGDRARQTGTTWASSADCPQMLAALRSISSVELPTFSYPMPEPSPSEPERPIFVPADGAEIRIWIDGRYGRSDGDHMGVAYSVEGNVDSPAGVWFESMQAQLSNCWQERLREEAP